MAEEPNEDDAFWRPPWESDDEAGLELPGPPRPRQPTAEPDHTHPLLAPLARAQDAVARLEARAEAASPALAEGLRARMAYREAAGWLAHSHIWIHPHDLALRDAGLTGSYGAADQAGRLAGELPATVAHGAGFDAIPSDVTVNLALRFARTWRRLAEFRTWKPLANAAALREMLQSLGFSGAFDPIEADEWLASAQGRAERPVLIRAGQAARDWTNRSKTADPLSLDSLFLAACLWRERGFGRPIPLPFWASGDQRLHRLALKFGLDWTAGFLECVAAAAHVAMGELDRLRQAEQKGRTLAVTARSKLPAALDTMLRTPILTARGLSTSLDVSPQAALGLIGQLRHAGIVREATGRASWRAFLLT